MAKNFYSLITNVGRASIANATILNEKVNFKFLALGDGGIIPSENQTKLNNERWRGQISTIKKHEKNNSWIVLETIIPSKVGGFTINELGVFDEMGNLLAVANYPSTYKPTYDEGSAKDLIIRLILEVSNAEVVELKIDPSVVLATKTDLLSKADLVEGKVPKEQLPEVEKVDISGKADLQGGKLKVDQLPDLSEYNEILLFTNKTSFDRKGNTEKLYIDKSEDKIYRWNGTTYVELSKQIEIGQTKGTAFDGAMGKALEDKLNQKYYTKADVDKIVKVLKEEISNDIIEQILLLS